MKTKTRAMLKTLTQDQVAAVLDLLNDEFQKAKAWRDSDKSVDWEKTHYNGEMAENLVIRKVFNNLYRTAKVC